MKKTLVIIVASFLCFLVAVGQQNKDYFRFPTETDMIYDICFTNHGEAIAIADNNSIKVYSTDSRTLLGDFANGHRDQILSIDISIDSTLLISGGKDSTVAIWDFKEGKLLKSIKCSGIICSVRLSPDNQLAVYGGTDRKVSVYDITRGETIRAFSKHSDDITSVSFSPDGRYIASCSGDNNIHIYEEGELITILSCHRNWVRDIAFNADGTELVSCDDNGTIILWNISNKKNPMIINKSWFGFNWLLCVDFHKDGKAYAVGNVKGRAKIVGKFADYSTNVKSPINRILFKPDETYLTVAIATRGKGVLLIESKYMKHLDSFEK